VAERLTRTESNLLMATWFVAGAVLIALNRQGGPQAAAMILSCVLFGAATSAGAALLFPLRLRRRILAAATVNTIGRDTAPGVRARLLLMWLMSSALPTVGIAAVVIMRSHGWIIEKTASVEIPVVVLSLVSVVVGLRGMMVVALSVSDPVRDVVEAMAKVEHGDIDVAVDVYERSEIGRLQNGFNRMVAGLAERDRLRDLFGRRSGGIHPVGAEPITGGGGRGA
jgi:methyl-accepting chemotaxis protein